MKRLFLAAALLMSAFATSGSVPVAIGDLSGDTAVQINASNWAAPEGRSKGVMVGSVDSCASTIINPDSRPAKLSVAMSFDEGGSLFSTLVF